MSSFCVVSYNILAESYVRAECYPNTPEEFLKPSERIERVIERLLALSQDIACLQAVEPTVFESVEASLETHEYAGSYVKKAKGRPDGCATFYKSAMLEKVQWMDVVYEDSIPGGEATGHVAQLKLFKEGSRRSPVPLRGLKAMGNPARRLLR